MKILKCPKCGGRAYRQYDRIGNKWIANKYVRCPKCGVKVLPPTEASSRQGVGPAEKPNGLGSDKGMHCQSDKHPSDCCEPKGKATDRAVRDNKLDRVTSEEP